MAWLGVYKCDRRWWHSAGQIVRFGGPFRNEEEAQLAADVARAHEQHIKAHSIPAWMYKDLVEPIDIDEEELNGLPRTLVNLGEREDGAIDV